MGENEDKVKAIFLRAFQGLEEDGFSLEKKQADYENWDSFAHMEMVSQVEKDFNVTLETDEVIAIESAQDVLTLIAKKNE